jgi:hypothetical protein
MRLAGDTRRLVHRFFRFDLCLLHFYYPYMLRHRTLTYGTSQ